MSFKNLLILTLLFVCVYACGSVQVPQLTLEVKDNLLELVTTFHVVGPRPVGKQESLLADSSAACYCFKSVFIVIVHIAVCECRCSNATMSCGGQRSTLLPGTELRSGFRQALSPA